MSSMNENSKDWSKTVVNNCTGVNQQYINTSFYWTPDENNNGTQLYYKFTPQAIYDFSTMTWMPIGCIEPLIVLLYHTDQPHLQDFESLTTMPPLLTKKPTQFMLSHTPNFIGNSANTAYVSTSRDRLSSSLKTRLSNNEDYPVSEMSLDLDVQNATGSPNCMSSISSFQQNQCTTKILLSPPSQTNVHQILNTPYSRSDSTQAANVLPDCKIHPSVQNSESSSPDKQLSDLCLRTNTAATNDTEDSLTCFTSALPAVSSIKFSMQDQLALLPIKVDEQPSRSDVPNSTPKHCHKKFTQKSSLKLHETTHSDEKNFVCQYCDKRFACEDNLKRHIQTHMTHKPQHTCHIAQCGKAFKRVKSLKIHLNRHHDAKKYLCAHCDKGFMRKYSLIVHVQEHMNENRKNKNFYCHISQCLYPNCSVEINSKFRGLSGKLQHVCHVTDRGKILNIVPSLKMQLEKNSENKTFFCAYCSKKFSLIPDLCKHVVEHILVSKHDKLKKAARVSHESDSKERP